MFPIFDYWKPIEKYINVSSLHGPSDTCLILQVQHNLRRGGGGGRVKVVTNVVVYESIRKGQKKLCFAYLTDNPLSEKFSRWILANLSSFHTKRCYRKARLLQKNLLLKIIKYTHHPKKTTLSLLKQHYTVLECYNAYLDKEKQLELFITMIAVEKSVRSKSWFRGFHFLGFP